MRVRVLVRAGPVGLAISLPGPPGKRFYRQDERKGGRLVEDLLERIEADPSKLLGKPVIRGMRIPVYLIVEMVASGVSEEEILREYPELTREDIRAALLYAARAMEGSPLDSEEV